MAGSFSTVKAPPQTLERLDRWGTLDKLPWSLDDKVWTTAGEYALTLSDSCKSGGSCTGFSIRTHAMAGGGKTRETFSALRIREDENEDASLAGQSGILFRVKPIIASGDAESRDAMVIVRLRTPELTGLAALASEFFEFTRVRCIVPDAAEGAGGEEIFPEYKGWTWESLPEPAEGPWNGITTEAQSWTGLSSSDGIWEDVVQWQ